MKDRTWERPRQEREQVQQRRLRGEVIGYYAPREPWVMERVLRFLEVERRVPLALIHRIVDRLASISMVTTVVTLDEVIAFIQGLPDSFAIAVGPCACRLHTAEALGPDARDLAAGNLDFHRQTPLEVDIQIAKCGEKFGELPTYRMISKDELIDLERRCYNLGLVPNIYQMMGGEGGICHCSSRTCAPLLANAALKGKSAVIKRGRFIAVTDPGACDGTADCVQVCHFNARRLVTVDGKRLSTIDPDRCYGCGLCAAACPNHAISMVPR